MSFRSVHNRNLLFFFLLEGDNGALGKWLALKTLPMSRRCRLFRNEKYAFIINGFIV